jgi:hypothetical protein
LFLSAARAHPRTIAIDGGHGLAWL